MAVKGKRMSVTAYLNKLLNETTNDRTDENIDASQRWWRRLDHDTEAHAVGVAAVNMIRDNPDKFRNKYFKGSLTKYLAINDIYKEWLAASKKNPGLTVMDFLKNNKYKYVENIDASQKWWDAMNDKDSDAVMTAATNMTRDNPDKFHDKTWDDAGTRMYLAAKEIYKEWLAASKKNPDLKLIDFLKKY